MDITDWILLWITVNRIAAITWRTKLCWVVNLRTTCISLGVILVYSLCLNINYFWILGTHLNNNYQIEDRNYTICAIQHSPQIVLSSVLLFLNLEPLFPLAMQVVLSVFLGVRIVLIATKRIELLNNNTQSLQQQILSNDKCHSANNKLFSLDERRQIGRDVQIAIVIITFVIANILIDGTANVLNAIMQLINGKMGDELRYTDDSILSKLSTTLHNLSLRTYFSAYGTFAPISLLCQDFVTLFWTGSVH